MKWKRKIGVENMISQMEKNSLVAHRLKRLPHKTLLKRLELEVISPANSVEKVSTEKKTYKAHENSH